VRELAAIQELEERIKRLEKRILIQDKTIKRILDFVQRAIDTQLGRKSAKEDQERSKKGSAERMNRIMKELGYKTE
jgi:uncharacterized coiled-coil protein SlyX